MFPMKPFHCRNDSGELDVFEAARYFSGSIDTVVFAEEAWRPTEIIVTKSTLPDMSIEATQTSQQPQMAEEDKKGKQPTYPSGRLAAFLNSLFHQAASKKKAKSHVGEESHGGRSSSSRISLSQCIRSSDSDDNSTAITASKYFPKQEFSNGKPTPVALFQPERELWDVKRVVNDQPWLHEGPDCIRFVSDELVENRWAWKRNGDQEEEEEEEENGSHTSSDLFELKLYQLGDVSCDPSVFGSTGWKSTVDI